VLNNSSIKGRWVLVFKGKLERVKGKAEVGRQREICFVRGKGEREVARIRSQSVMWKSLELYKATTRVPGGGIIMGFSTFWVFERKKEEQRSKQKLNTERGKAWQRLIRIWNGMSRRGEKNHKF